MPGLAPAAPAPPEHHSLWPSVLGAVAAMAAGVGIGWAIKSATETSAAQANLDKVLSTLPKTPGQELVDRTKAIIAATAAGKAPPPDPFAQVQSILSAAKPSA